VSTTDDSTTIEPSYAAFSSPQQSRFRISLKTLLLLFAVTSVLLFAFVRYAYPHLARRMAISRIGEAGASVYFYDDDDRGNFSTGERRRPWQVVAAVEIDSDAQAPNIVSAVRDIPEVENLFVNSAVTDVGLVEIAKLQKHSSLQSLECFGTRITANGIAHLAKLDWLVLLHINTCPIGDQELQQIARLPGLKTLNLIEEGTPANPSRFKEAGYGAIGGMHGLETLWLVGHTLSDESAAELHKMTGLKTLRLSRCQISPAAVDALHSALPNCTIIRHED
jgi:hypothetical protein